MPEIIQRGMVDLALNTMESGLKEAVKDLKKDVNKDWGQLAQARKLAVDTRDDKIEAEESGRKKSRDAAVAAYRGAQGKPNAPSYESHVQDLGQIDEKADGEIEHARKVCIEAGQAAENTFRTQSKDNIATFRKKVNGIMEALEAAHP